MKQLKFNPELRDLICEGKKTSTWRMHDDKDLQAGDVITCVDSVSNIPFGMAVVTSCVTKTLGSLEEADWEGHERYVSEETMYQTYREYYGDEVGPDTELKILDFTFKPL